LLNLNYEYLIKNNTTLTLDKSTEMKKNRYEDIVYCVKLFQTSTQTYSITISLIQNVKNKSL
jgi:hypothetical protein